MNDAAPLYIPHEEMQRKFARGPVLGKGWELAALGKHIYRREGDRWRRLDSEPHATVADLVEANREP